MRSHVSHFIKAIARISVVVAVCALIVPLAALSVQSGNTVRAASLFEALPLKEELDQLNKARDMGGCLSGWRAFLAAGVGYEDFTDYWRDFILLPSHYADVAAIENQLNKARYAVMAAFLRCDTDRLTLFTNQYYKLEAELYYVRHYVDTLPGYLRIVTENPITRAQFVEDMVHYMLLRKGSKKPLEDEALFGGYFDVFEAKYRERARMYTSAGDDPIFGNLGEKFGELIDTLASFKELGSELADLGGDVVSVGTSTINAVANAGVNIVTSPVKTLKEAGAEVLNRFRICPETGDPEDCNAIHQLVGKGIEAAFSSEPGKKKTFTEVMISISQQEQQRSENITKTEMLTRYELLYGQVNGEGIAAIMDRATKLQQLLGNDQAADSKAGKPAFKGSLTPLNSIILCAADVQSRQCK